MYWDYLEKIINNWTCMQCCVLSFLLQQLTKYKQNRNYEQFKTLE